MGTPYVRPLRLHLRFPYFSYFAFGRCQPTLEGVYMRFAKQQEEEEELNHIDEESTPS